MPVFVGSSALLVAELGSCLHP